VANLSNPQSYTLYKNLSEKLPSYASPDEAIQLSAATSRIAKMFSTGVHTVLALAGGDRLVAAGDMITNVLKSTLARLDDNNDDRAKDYWTEVLGRKGKEFQKGHWVTARLEELTRTVALFEALAQQYDASARLTTLSATVGTDAHGLDVEIGNTRTAIARAVGFQPNASARDSIIKARFLERLGPERSFNGMSVDHRDYLREMEDLISQTTDLKKALASLQARMTEFYEQTRHVATDTGPFQNVDSVTRKERDGKVQDALKLVNQAECSYKRSLEPDKADPCPGGSTAKPTVGGLVDSPMRLTFIGQHLARLPQPRTVPMTASTRGRRDTSSSWY
jgi:hypothetical protein